MTIYLYDDSPTAVFLAEQALQEQNIEPVVLNGPSDLAALRLDSSDVVLVDWYMPPNWERGRDELIRMAIAADCRCFIWTSNEWLTDKPVGVGFLPKQGGAELIDILHAVVEAGT